MLGSGWDRANAATQERAAKRRQRVLNLTIAGMTAQQIADRLGEKVQRQTVVRERRALREAGLLGCCMDPQNSCSNGPPSDCKYLII